MLMVVGGDDGEDEVVGDTAAGGWATLWCTP